MREMRNAHKILDGKPKVKITALETQAYLIDRTEIGCDDVYWTHLGQCRKW
jgi:hypothetical protein